MISVLLSFSFIFLTGYKLAFNYLKAKKHTLKDLKVRPLGEEGTSLWTSGLEKAKGQNLARTLMETPANYMTPTLFAQVRFISIDNQKVPIARKRTQFLKSTEVKFQVKTVMFPHSLSN